MARKVEVQGAGTVKVIHPAVAFLLAIVTLGIYYIFWYGIRNSELNDFGEAVSPGENELAVSTFLAIVAITIGGLLIVPPFISQWRFYKRIGRAQELVGLQDRISHVTGILLFALALFLLPFEVAYAQHHLNRLWEREVEREERRRLGVATEPLSA
jgi:formate hydrogenlyase subunit 3/multisubunit Na+/H+ antiporter MnhD subunit